MRLLVFFLTVAASALQVLPPVQFHDIPGDKGFSLTEVERVIYIETNFTAWRDQDGLTLIPPSALEFAKTFRDDLATLTNSSWNIPRAPDP